MKPECKGIKDPMSFSLCMSLKDGMLYTNFFHYVVCFIGNGYCKKQKCDPSETTDRSLHRMLLVSVKTGEQLNSSSRLKRCRFNQYM